MQNTRYIMEHDDEYKVTLESLKRWHEEYPNTQSVEVRRLLDSETYLGPAGKIVSVAFHCIACKKKFRTHGKGQFSWKKTQEPGARAAWAHAQGSRHLKKHELWLQKSQQVKHKKNMETPPSKRNRVSDAAWHELEELANKAQTLLTSLSDGGVSDASHDTASKQQVGVILVYLNVI